MTTMLRDAHRNGSVGPIAAAVSVVLLSIGFGCGSSSGDAHPKVIVDVAATQSPRTPSFPARLCPEGMTLVEGEYCLEVEHRCLRWLDPPGRYHQFRCAEYARPAVCKSGREHKRFCADIDERREESSRLPQHAKSWVEAEDACRSVGARVCTESEWTFACEGEEMRPYPYGWKRDASLCNSDQRPLYPKGDNGHLLDLRVPVGSRAGCVSAFGLHDMAGNVAEWVSVDGASDGSSVVQKGAWWHPGKHACRDAQTGHDRFYKGTETGFRCCSNPRM